MRTLTPVAGGARRASLGLLLASQGALGSAMTDALLAIPENHWGVISTNSYIDAWPDASFRDFDVDHLSGTPANTMNAWSSFAWDSKRGDLVLYGGGHSNYAGNEVYRWRSETLQWERGSLPSQVRRIGSTDLYAAIDGSDNAPTSTHTYDNNLYLPIADRFVVLGGAAWQTGAPLEDESFAKTGPYFWDPAKGDPNKVGGTDDSDTNPAVFVQGGQMWENRHHTPDNSVDWQYTREAASEAVVESGRDVMYIASARYLWRYTVNDVNDASMDTLTRVGSASNIGGMWGQGAGSVDTTNNYFLRAANAGLFAYDLDTPGLYNYARAINPKFSDGTPWSTTQWLGSWGIDYDETRNRFLLWNGLGELWSLVAPSSSINDDWIIEPVINFALSGIGLPNVWKNGTSTNGGGVMGKWEYIPDYDIYLATYHTITGDVWAFKPSDWGPSAALFGITPVGATGWLMLFGLLLAGRARVLGRT